ncbi:hypothetical protein [Foetidibacter luteolus]|uniref:hypothetical protein n=1 Tax=Foetidibacter luteolus TaxID=2608880 RepID=UPI00129B59D6|nr:hypothetical protein [Foetidibacter luteolus]
MNDNPTVEYINGLNTGYWVSQTDAGLSKIAGILSKQCTYNNWMQGLRDGRKLAILEKFGGEPERLKIRCQ